MGGKKRPTISQLEKRARREQAAKQQEQRAKPKMSMTAEGKLSEGSLEAIYREVSGRPYVTPFLLHSEFGIKISEAKRVLRRLEEQGLIKLVGGNRRVSIYVPVAA